MFIISIGSWFFPFNLCVYYISPHEILHLSWFTFMQSKYLNSWNLPTSFDYMICDFYMSLTFTMEKAMAPHSSTLAWKIHGQRNLVGCSPWGREESDTTERLHFHFLLLYIGEGNGNPLQCSCLENPRGREAWWAVVYGVAQSRTWLKRLSSSSSNIYKPLLEQCSIKE